MKRYPDTGRISSKPEISPGLETIITVGSASSASVIKISSF